MRINFKNLTVQVLIAIVLVIIVGAMFPEFGASLKILADIFIKRPPAKAGGFGHKCRRLKSVFKDKVLLKALMLKHTELGLSSIFNSENVISVFIKLIGNIVSYNFFCYRSNRCTKISSRP